MRATWGRVPRLLTARGRLGLFTVAFVEAVDASGRVHEFLLAREERVARRADFHVQVVLAGRTRGEILAAGADDFDFVVFGMNSVFHVFLPRDRREFGSPVNPT